MEEQSYNNEENGQEAVATLREYLFDSKDQEEITQKEYVKSCKRFNKHVLLYLIENPGLLAIILSVMSGCLLAIWSLATTIILNADVQNTDHIINFINNMNDSMSWVALLSAAFVCVVYTIVSSWGREKFCERKYGETMDVCSQRKGSPKRRRYFWMAFNLVIVFLNAVLLTRINIDYHAPKEMALAFLFNISFIISIFHCWTLINRKSYEKNNTLIRLLLRGNESLGLILFGLLSLLVSYFLLRPYPVNETFIYIVSLFSCFYCVLWAGVIGIQCVGVMISRKTTKPISNSDFARVVRKRQYWILRDLRIWIITFICVCLALILAFVGWIIVAANVVEDLSFTIASFYVGN